MKLLVVEDDAKVARFLTRMLREEGYTADTCASGLEAIERARSGVYDLVLLDWMLPDIDGLEVCARLRGNGCNLPILMLTARGEVKEKVLGLRSGADDYLVKPFEIDELLARIQALLRREARTQKTRLGPLEIHRMDRRFLLDGVPLELTRRETELLLFLVDHAGRVVTRSELLASVWGIQFDPETNVIDVQIRRLREKLGRYAGLVETVRGQGYRLRPDGDVPAS